MPYNLVFINKVIQIKFNDFFDFQRLLFDDPILQVCPIDQINVDFCAFAEFLEFDHSQIELIAFVIYCFVVFFNNLFFLDEINEIIFYFLFYFYY